MPSDPRVSVLTPTSPPCRLLRRWRSHYSCRVEVPSRARQPRGQPTQGFGVASEGQQDDDGSTGVTSTGDTPSIHARRRRPLALALAGALALVLSLSGCMIF